MRDARIVFVTGNEHKRREVREILGVELEAADPDVPEIQGVDPAEVAAAKALAAREALGSPEAYVLAEDSGIMVGAWNGFPGALTKWLMGSVGNEGLLGMLSGFEDRSARSVCVAAVAAPDGSVRTFRGEVVGEVAPEARGEGGFGYDPVFIPEWSALTYAELGEEKNRDSHRARAFQAVRRWLEGV
ncbi:MAG: Nucleoside 5-triphosphatase RdgB (dHAPTP, dITP, XTP-specific) [uncultured Rubrobacteraceae bacterium]|uniref:Nucleoside 5-triphosphatase RdgB (DHAPTP, dITP, XTP-specific) n=1 Tax=uncultured Rubrobacteraceae bacterium TaxID=349277 RepID=A0A6J4Q872_9ACTN|nr:MAG: Nucleoside 5-triphosphatase RdgB (dHAPTP, dITP, XTP-specific) [uncultured Rubrobacteraceae bacterium]